MHVPEEAVAVAVAVAVPALLLAVAVTVNWPKLVGVKRYTEAVPLDEVWTWTEFCVGALLVELPSKPSLSVTVNVTVLFGAFVPLEFFTRTTSGCASHSFVLPTCPSPLRISTVGAAFVAYSIEYPSRSEMSGVHCEWLTPATDFERHRVL